MTFSGVFDVFFFLSSDLWAPSLPCSKCQQPSCTWCIVPYPLSPLIFRSHSLYSGFWSHKFLKTHFAHCFKSFTRETTRKESTPTQIKKESIWRTRARTRLFAERANSTKHLIGPYYFRHLTNQSNEHNQECTRAERVRRGIMIIFICFLLLCVAAFLPVTYIYT